MYFDGGLPEAKIDVIRLVEAVAADALTKDDAFKRTYLGHGRMSSVFVFQGHPGRFRNHVHIYHDEIAYVLKGTGTVTIGDDTREVRPGDVWVIPAGTAHTGNFGDEVHLLFVSAPAEDPKNPDRVWLD
jgi:quercetin dioxygenase-like cupin family protein